MTLYVWPSLELNDASYEGHLGEVLVTYPQGSTKHFFIV